MCPVAGWREGGTCYHNSHSRWLHGASITQAVGGLLGSRLCTVQCSCSTALALPKLDSCGIKDTINCQVTQSIFAICLQKCTCKHLVTYIHISQKVLWVFMWICLWKHAEYFPSNVKQSKDILNEKLYLRQIYSIDIGWDEIKIKFLCAVVPSQKLHRSCSPQIQGVIQLSTNVTGKTGIIGSVCKTNLFYTLHTYLFL